MDPVCDSLAAPSPASPTEDVRLKAWAIEAAVEREEAADEARDPPRSRCDGHVLLSLTSLPRAVPSCSAA